MKRLVAASTFALVLSLAPSAQAQQDPQGTFYLGYSFMRLDVGAGKDDTHGAEIDYTYFLDRRVGFTFSFSGHWGQLPAPPNHLVISTVDARQLTFLAGPHLVLFRGLTSEAGLRLLAGTTNRHLDSHIGSVTLLDRWKFTAAATGNLELRLGDRIWVRLPQASVLFYKFGRDWTTEWRIGAGIVIRGGEILQ